MRALRNYGRGWDECTCVHVCVWSMGGGWAGCSLIPEENVEEINLNYKDEASLESGSGRGTEGKESGAGGIYYCCAFLYFGRCCIFFFNSSCGNEVACLPSFLASSSDHSDTPPSLAHVQASYQLVSSVAAACVDRTPQSLLSSLSSLLTDNRCLGFSGNMRLFAGLY